MYFLVNAYPPKPLDVVTLQVPRPYNGNILCNIMYFLVNVSPPKPADEANQTLQVNR